MRQGKVLVSNVVAGIITEDDNGFTFQYDSTYLKQKSAEPISLTFPLQEMPFQNDVLFPFFDGLIPEGWMLNIAERNWKIRRHDRMGLLLTCCRDCIGNVSIEPIEIKEER